MNLTLEQKLGIFRHIMTGVGSVLIMRGSVDMSTWEILTGSVLGIVGIVWSVKSKS